MSVSLADYVPLLVVCLIAMLTFNDLRPIAILYVAKDRHLMVKPLHTTLLGQGHEIGGTEYCMTGLSAVLC